MFLFVHLSNLSRLVVSSQNGETIFVAHFERQQQRHSFNRIISKNKEERRNKKYFLSLISPSVHIVAHKEKIRLRRLSTWKKIGGEKTCVKKQKLFLLFWIESSVLFTDAKQFHDVVKLSVHIAAHSDGTFDGLHVGLFNQSFARLVAQIFHLRLRQRFAFLVHFSSAKPSTKLFFFFFFSSSSLFFLCHVLPWAGWCTHPPPF